MDGKTHGKKSGRTWIVTKYNSAGLTSTEGFMEKMEEQRHYCYVKIEAKELQHLHDVLCALYRYDHNPCPENGDKIKAAYRAAMKFFEGYKEGERVRVAA